MGTALHGNVLVCMCGFLERGGASADIHGMPCCRAWTSSFTDRKQVTIGEHFCYPRLLLKQKKVAPSHFSSSSVMGTSQELTSHRVRKPSGGPVALMDYDALSTEYEWGGLDISQPLPSPALKTPTDLPEAPEMTKGRRGRKVRGGVIVKEDDDSWQVEESEVPRRPRSGTLGMILRKKMLGGLSPGGMGGIGGGHGGSHSRKLAVRLEREEEEEEEAGRDELSSGDEELSSESRSLPPRLRVPLSPKSRARLVAAAAVALPSSPREGQSPLRSASLSPRRPSFAAEAALVPADAEEARGGARQVGDERGGGSGELTHPAKGRRRGGGGWHVYDSHSNGSSWEDQAYEIIQRQKSRALAAAAEGQVSLDVVGEETQQRRREEEIVRSGSATPVSVRRGRGSAPKTGRTKSWRRGGAEVLGLAEGERTSFASAFEKLAHDLGLDRRRHALIAYLQEELGLGAEDLAKIASRHRACLSLSVDVVRARVAELARMGVGARDVCRLVVRHPQALEYSSERIEAHAAYLRNLGVREGDMGKVITVAPILLAYTVDSLQERVEFLQSQLNVHGEDLRKIILRSPQILTQSVDDSLEPRLCYLCDEVGVSRSALARMVVRHPQLLHYSIEGGLRPRIAFLQSIGIKGDDVASVISRFSQVLSLSVENNLNPKYRYLVKFLGGGPKTVTTYPAYFSLSLGHRIRPRHLYLVSKKRMPYGPFPMKNLAITDLQFVQEVAKSSMEDYLEFRKSLSSDEDEGMALRPAASGGAKV